VKWIAVILVLALPGPMVPQAELEAVVLMLEGGRLDAAESELRRIVDQSGNPTARALLSRLLLRQGRTDEALIELRAAAKVAPLERQLAFWLADAELAQGHESQAEAQWLSVDQRYTSVRALLQLARLQARRGQTEAAAKMVGRARQIAPNSEEVLAAHARVSLSAGAPVVAIRALEALIRIHPTVSEYSYLLGVARLQIGDMGGAVEALELSLALEPGRPLPWVALGSALVLQKQYEKAREALRRSLRLDPESTEALAALAEAEEGLGEYDQAEEHAAQALARQANHPRALMALGLVRMRQLRYEEARDVFLQTVSHEPGLSKAHYQLSLAFVRLGDRESSEKHLELYRSARKKRDEHLVELRTQAGLENPGTDP
jgi:tetratricopeptide (TPR) repeat protein